jgi:hypothetical protein
MDISDDYVKMNKMVGVKAGTNPLKRNRSLDLAASNNGDGVLTGAQEDHLDKYY